VLVELASRSGNEEFYLSEAIQRLTRPEDKALILQGLADDHKLAGLVVKYGWQADARDTLVSGLEHETHGLPDDWIKAVASLQDPSTYPALKAYLVKGRNRGEIFKAIKQLPGLDLTDAVDEMWKKAKYASPWEAMNACGIAAQYGHADALETAAGVLKTSKNQYETKQAREVITKFTGASGDDKALVAWVEGNKGKLGFDAGSGKFVVRQ
jgi:hypothetical protein